MRGGLFILILLLPLLVLAENHTDDVNSTAGATLCPEPAEIPCGVIYANAEIDCEFIGSACAEEEICVEGVCLACAASPLAASDVACGSVEEQLLCSGEVAHISGSACPSNEVCLEGVCLHCFDTIPDAEDIACGEVAVTRLCSGPFVEVGGIHCEDPLTYCDAGDCVEQRYALAYDDARVVAGEILRLHLFVEPPIGNVIYTVEGWFEGATDDGILTYRTSHEDIGSQELEVSAIHIAGLTTEELLPPTSIEIIVECNPGDRTYGACCIEGTSRFKGRGSSCAWEADEPNSGSCTDDGQCERICAPAVERRCNAKLIQWFNSCGEPGSVIQDCSLSNRTCREESGQPACSDQRYCRGDYSYECRANEGVRVDTSCGKATTLITCAENEACEVRQGTPHCRRKSLCEDLPGRLACNGQCIDPLSDRSNCGACNLQCGQNDLCVDGACEPIAGCTVVCDSNDDCGNYGVCINPGDCAKSECQPLNLLTQEEPDATRAAAQIATTPIAISHAINEEVIHFTVTNLAGISLTSIRFLVEIPKVIAQHASSLQVKGASYDVIEEDPILHFTMPPLATSKEFTITAEKRLDESYEEAILVKEIEHPPVEELDLLELWSETKDALTIGMNSYGNEETFFTLVLTPKQHLTGLRVALELPPCIDSSELRLDQQAHILNNLLIWDFDQLSEEESLTFSLPYPVDEACQGELRATAFSKVGRPINPWWSLALLPLLGFLLILYQRLFPHAGEGHMKKEEFYAVGRQQGLPESKIQEDWQDYKRRF